ncbi:MAG TPA: hypothetical protein PK830_10475 [Candidatus Atribacteria bacterium]|nr:hypothetical protein [Candidatus Atribacteria bacterium]HPT79499.1 hypothetical protein [Candidatus Atribacteria bacterium]
MQSAKIVYMLIGLFMLLPWTAYNVKVLLGILKRKKSDKSLIVRRIALFAGVAALMAGLVVYHYNFTIGYQAPLVAERAGVLFQQHLSGELDLDEYKAKMHALGIAATDLTVDPGTAATEAGQERYSLKLSERTYTNEDDSVTLYFLHENESASYYSYVRMIKSGNKWLVTEHKVLTSEQVEGLPKLRYFTIIE